MPAGSGGKSLRAFSFVNVVCCSAYLPISTKYRYIAGFVTVLNASRCVWAAASHVDALGTAFTLKKVVSYLQSFLVHNRLPLSQLNR